MTITEHLNLSVLSAPIASVDRRALSQAWYSALYGDRNGSSGTGATLQKMQPQSATSVRKPQGRHKDAAHGRSPALPTATRRTKASAHWTCDADRRTRRSPLAEKIQRTFVRPHRPARRACFDLEGRHGRVQIVLQSHGSRLTLVALCAPAAAQEVARALAQVRYALAQRGIELHAATREHASC